MNRKVYLKETIKSYDLTMKAVAKELGIKSTNLTAIDKGRDTASLSKLDDIAKAIADLSGGDKQEIFCKIVGC